MSEFRDIPGLETLYAANESGQIKNLVSEVIIKPHLNFEGYPRVNVRSAAGGKRPVEVHRLVALAWLPNPLGLPMVNHRDGNKANNQVSNLCWASYHANSLHSRRMGASKLRKGKEVTSA